MSPEIRDLTLDDAIAMAGIYNDAVAKRLATFDESPTPVAEIEADLRANLRMYPGLAVVLDSAVIRIRADNTASRALCASLGFREVGIYEHHARLDGAWRDVAIIEKLLEKP